MYPPKNSKLPLTKTRLNFYIAQHTRSILQNSSKNIRDQSLSKGKVTSREPIQNFSHCEDSLFGKSIKSIGEPLESPRQGSIFGEEKENQSRWEVSCERDGILKTRANLSPRNQAYLSAKTKEDSLDEMVLSQLSSVPNSERRDLRTDREALLPYFQPQGRNNTLDVKNKRRSVHWNQTLDSSLRYQQQTGNLKEISNHLSAITFELNRNNKKLRELHSLNDPPPRPSKQQTLKRVNFKHSKAYQLQRTKAQESQIFPRVIYNSRIHQDPKLFIWNPTLC